MKVQAKFWQINSSKIIWFQSSNLSLPQYCKSTYPSKNYKIMGKKKPIWFHLMPCATRYTCTFLDTHLRFSVSIFPPFVLLSVLLSLIWLCPSDLHGISGQATFQLFFSQLYCSFKNLRWASNSYLTFILNHLNPFRCFNNESDNYNTDLIFAWECDLISLLFYLSIGRSDAVTYQHTSVFCSFLDTSQSNIFWVHLFSVCFPKCSHSHQHFCYQCTV